MVPIAFDDIDPTGFVDRGAFPRRSHQSALLGDWSPCMTGNDLISHAITVVRMSIEAKLRPISTDLTVLTACTTSSHTACNTSDTRNMDVARYATEFAVVKTVTGSAKSERYTDDDSTTRGPVNVEHETQRRHVQRRARLIHPSSLLDRLASCLIDGSAILVFPRCSPRRRGR